MCKIDVQCSRAGTFDLKSDGNLAFTFYKVEEQR